MDNLKGIRNAPGELGSTAHKITLASDANCRVWGFLRPPSGLIIQNQDSQNSPKTVILMVMIYYNERVQVKVSQGKICLGQSSRKFQMWSFCLSPSSRIMVSVKSPGNNVWQYDKILPTWEGQLILGCLEFLLGLRHEYMIDCLCDSVACPTLCSAPPEGKPRPHGPKTSVINHIVRLHSVAQIPKVNKDTLIRQDIPEAKRLFPSSQSKGQTSFGVRLILYSRALQMRGWLNY